MRSASGFRLPLRVWTWSAALAVAAVVLGTLAAQVDAAVPANGRAWELVTEHEPSSTRNLGMRPMDANGEQIIYGTVGPPPGTQSGAALGYGVASRGPSGWVDTALGIPYHTESTEVFNLLAPILPIAFSGDERTALWLASVPLTPGGPPVDQLALYRKVAEGAPELIAEVGGKGPIIVNFAGFADIAKDGSRVVFTAGKHLLPGDAGRTQGESIYAWDGSGLELVDVDGGGALLSTCGSSISSANGMSASASRVFFSVSSACGLEKVYLRDLETDSTTEISASECTRIDCNAAASAQFAGATPDGQLAYITTTQQLTNADHDSSRDLYRYDVSTGDLSLLSGAPTEVTGEVMPGLVFPSETGGRVYFRASGEMIPGESTPDQKLFVADAGGLHLVAVASFPSEAEIQLSADGKRALFVTQSKVLGTDTDSVGDAYLYDDEGETVTKVSTGPSGGNGAAAAGIAAPSPLNRREFEFGNLRPYYAIDAAGDRVFFTTEESLVPEDTNGQFDVYEWWNGEIGLITPGYQPQKSDFAGVSRDGRTVGFATNATLLPEDEDGDGRDLYVARLGGGFPKPETPPGCSNATCPLPAGNRITRPTPASLIPIQVQRGQLRVVDVASEVEKGAIAVVVSVPAPGRVTGVIWAREGGKKAILARGSTRAKRPGKVQLSLRLTSSARRSVGGGAKSAHLTVSAGSSKASQAVKVAIR